jgi:hypothetical protein
MRKVLTLAVAALLATGVAAAPASAATPKAGAKCTERLATAKAGTARLYCGKNTNVKTKKKYKLAWIKFTACYNGIIEYKKTDAQYKDAVLQLANIKVQLAALDTATRTVMTPQVQQLDLAVAQLAPVAATLGQGIRQMCP